jgi:hypothetical protein
MMYVYKRNGASPLGRVTPNGSVEDYKGKRIGEVLVNGVVYDSTGTKVGEVQSGGSIQNSQGREVGVVLFTGTIHGTGHLPLGSVSGMNSSLQRDIYFAGGASLLLLLPLESHTGWAISDSASSPPLPNALELPMLAVFCSEESSGTD